MKRILSSTLIVLTLFTAFIIGYSKGCNSYAEDIHYMTDAELEAAYQAYLQSKGGGLIGNAGARMTYMNGKLLNFMTSSNNNTGISTIDGLKSEMTWQKTQLENGQGVLSLGLTNRGLGFLNLYTQWLLQNHYFGNGVNETDGMFDNGVDNEVYSGYVYTDDNGNNCLVYMCDTSCQDQTIQQTNLTFGTPYIYSENDLVSIIDGGTRTITVSPKGNYTLTLYYTDNTNYTLYGCNNGNVDMSSGKIKVTRKGASTSNIYNGNLCIWYSRNYSQFHIGVYTKTIRPWDNNSVRYTLSDIGTLNQITSDRYNNVNVNFYTNNNNNINVYPTINEGDTLYITPKVDVGVNGTVDFQPYIINEGDNITNIVNNYYVDSGTPDNTITVPSDQPSGGGGGSGGGDDNPSGPSGGNLPNWPNSNIPFLSPDGNGGFNINFSLPDLNIDWNISGLQEKFPFSIPFDLIRFISVLNAEPQTPEFDWTIDLRIYQWHIDADLHQFDNLAGIVRNVEFIGFCITLVMITRRMIKG